VIHLFPGPFSLLQLVTVTDVNLAVSLEATQAIGNLAKGLRTHFLKIMESAYSSSQNSHRYALLVVVLFGIV
jgi:hypothetical protein